MEDVVKKITHKYIIIKDIGRDLNPIGYNFKSPILKPSLYPLETIRKLLAVSGVTSMFEVYEPDPTLKVSLDLTNYSKDFQTLWEAENPGKIFPWSNSIIEVKTEMPVITKPSNTDDDKTHVEIDLGDGLPVSKNVAKVNDSASTVINTSTENDSALTDESSNVSGDGVIGSSELATSVENSKPDETIVEQSDKSDVVSDKIEEAAPSEKAETAPDTDSEDKVDAKATAAAHAKKTHKRQ